MNSQKGRFWILASTTLIQVVLFGVVGLAIYTSSPVEGDKGLVLIPIMAMMIVMIIQVLMAGYMMWQRSIGQMFGFISFVGFNFYLLSEAMAVRDDFFCRELTLVSFMDEYRVRLLVFLGLLFLCQMFVDMKMWAVMKELRKISR